MLSRLGAGWARTAPNPLTQAIARRRAAGHAWLDLVTANPHEHGLVFPARMLDDILEGARRQTRVYRPDPRGQPAARQAVTDYYRRRGFRLDADHVILTPGTSLGYLYLFWVLLNPGDEILVPRPGYPLFEDVALMAGCRLRYYHLSSQDAAWRLDLEELEFQCTGRTRAVVLVSPHNPLGLVTQDWEGLAAICQRHDLTLVVDEVFCEFLTSAEAVYHRVPAAAFPRVCLLNGISKMLSLPGLKLGWIAVPGDDALLAALEYVSDIFLPVSELVQAAAPALLQSGETVAAALAAEYRRRRGLVEAQLPVLAADGGVYACLPLPPSRDEDDLALQLLEQQDVLVHPGHFYHLPQHLVLTCVAGADQLEEGCRRIRTLLEAPGDTTDSG